MTISKSKYTGLSDATIRAALQDFAVRFSAQLADQIRRYMDLLLLWNQRVNLTSILQPREILVRHFGESMFAAPAVPVATGHLVDAGAGAGFPGLALKLLLSGLKLTLIESSQKKSAFLKETVRRLELQDVTVLTERFEDVQTAAGFADFVAARAVGNYGELLAWAGRALRTDGKLILWLGQSDAQQVQRRVSWDWREPIRIPQSSRRVLLVGSYKPK